MQDNIILKEPLQDEFLKIAQFSFENYVKENALSTGQSALALMEKLGNSPKRGKNDLWFIIEQQGKNIGFIWIKLNPIKKSALGYDIYLEPAARSQGIGRHVMNLCGQKLKLLEINSIEICVFKHNKIARKLYNSLGFKIKTFDKFNQSFTLSLSL